MTEEWKDIEDFDGRYQISNHGRVRGQTGLVLALHKERYLQVALRKAGSRKQYHPRVHNLVAHHFIGPRPSDMVVDHIDANKENNHVTNLRYVSKSMNSRHKPNRRRGVSLHRRSGMWVTFIKIDGKSTNLGYRWDKEEAYQLYFDKYIEITGEKPWH